MFEIWISQVIVVDWDIRDVSVRINSMLLHSLMTTDDLAPTYARRMKRKYQAPIEGAVGHSGWTQLSDVINGALTMTLNLLYIYIKFGLV